jgi:putative CRISPR-associated protein (TIGR02619 family)
MDEEKKWKQKEIKIISTVGESLKTNYFKDRLEEILKENQQISESIIKELYSMWIDKNLNKDLLEKRISRFWENYSADSIKSCPCAEMQSLLLFFKNLKEGEEKYTLELVFIPTTETKELAELISESLEKRNFDDRIIIRKTIVKEPVDLEVKTAEEFQKGLSSLTESILVELPPKCSKEFDEFYVNITGGYKGIAPFNSLIAFLNKNEKIRVFYAHENSNFVLFIPPLPVSWDLKKADELRSIIKSDSISKSEFNALPNRFKSLFKKKDFNCDYERNPFGNLINEFYFNNRNSRLGFGYYIIEDYLNNNAYKENLLGKLPEWEHLWIGNQIPEAVDHFRGHSLRLLEMLYTLLRDYNSDDLIERLGGYYGLYILICAIWLHDIGHSALEYKNYPISLMPTLIKDWHHLSSEDKILRNCYINDEKDKKLVSLIAKYHREKMKLRGDKFDIPYDNCKLLKPVLGDAQFKSLEEYIDNNSEYLINGLISSNLLLITAILKFLDACDTQFDRVIDEPYKEMRKKRTSEEINFLKKELKNLGLNNSFNNYLNEVNDYCNDIDKFIESDFSKSDSIECEINKIKQRESQLNKEIINGFKKTNEDKKFCDREGYSILNKITFKKSQELQFFKHSSIVLVYLKKVNEKLRVYYLTNENSSEALLSWIAKEMGEEINKVSSFLKENGIEVEGIFRQDGSKFTL